MGVKSKAMEHSQEQKLHFNKYCRNPVKRGTRNRPIHRDSEWNRGYQGLGGRKIESYCLMDTRILVWEDGKVLEKDSVNDYTIL